MSTSAVTVEDADCAGYELDYLDETGQSRRGPLSLMWGRAVRARRSGPVFPLVQGPAALVGLVLVIDVEPSHRF